ncbi:MAG: hypothetical protein HUU21_05560 [Polyangiaceae bacterium]|nr:hypothetical protein [Polyangiaceae bacterium]NUQ73002.1 hypothetical protein [Polyangiaceae bacterium]
MPLLDNLDFTKNDLTVSYRGNLEPQTLTIYAAIEIPEEAAYGPRFITTLMDVINAGGAGGSHFHPAAGLAELLSGPTYPEAEGPQFNWDLRVAGVSPLFMRNIVESLRLCGGVDNPAIAMSIRGSLPLDDTELSVREAEVKAWLEEPLAYVGEWPDPGFPIKQRMSPGAALRIRLGKNLNAETEDELKGVCIQWLAATYNYVNEFGEPILDEPDRLARLMPKFGATRRELRAYYEEFTRIPGPSRAVIVNMLARYHAQVLPITDVELALEA